MFGSGPGQMMMQGGQQEGLRVHMGARIQHA